MVVCVLYGFEGKLFRSWIEKLNLVGETCGFCPASELDLLIYTHLGFSYCLYIKRSEFSEFADDVIQGWHEI